MQSDDGRTYEIDVPVHVKISDERILAPIPFVPVHEAIADEVEQDPNIVSELQTQCNSNALPKYYYDHPVVIAEPPGTVLPTEIYIDAAPFNKLDSALGFFLINLISGTRTLLGTLRKSSLCKCGCKGWCSVFSVLQLIQFGALRLQGGHHSMMRADYKPWKAGDYVREALAGLALPIKGILSKISGDWMEYCSTIGYPTWGTQASPCPFCFCTRDNMYCFDGMAVEHNCWGRKDMRAYETACGQCDG